MKLQSGKTYVMRNGDVIGPMYLWWDDGKWHKFDDIGICFHAYEDNGETVYGKEEFDIVSQYFPEGAVEFVE